MSVRAIAIIDNITVPASAETTVLQLKTEQNRPIKIVRWGIYFNGIVSYDRPIRVELCRQTTAGILSVGTVSSLSSQSDTASTSAYHSATSEPAKSVILDVAYVHPQSGYEVIFPLGQEIDVPGDSYLGITCLSSKEINCIGKIQFEE